MANVRVAIVGATGYGGVGLIEILLRHPKAEIIRIFSQADVGTPISQLYPHFKGFCDLPIQSLDEAGRFENIDIVFFSTPDGVGQTHAQEWLDHGIKVVDFSGDFRFRDASQYAGYAKRISKSENHAAAALLKKTVYGIPELHRDEIKKAAIVGNPGCFAVACILGLAPAVQRSVVHRTGIICDCKSGVSGAGKKLNASHHYPARYDAVNAYKIAGHQHVYEIEQELELQVTFTPHVLPMTRGILATLYADLTSSPAELIAAYKDFYKDEPFVRILDKDASPSTSDVRGSNFVNIWVNHDPRTNKAIIVSHIDNLMKGQAGNAVQNMNLMTGLEEDLGLKFCGQYP